MSTGRQSARSFAFRPQAPASIRAIRAVRSTRPPRPIWATCSTRAARGLALLLPLFSGCGSDDTPPEDAASSAARDGAAEGNAPWFREEAEARGLVFQHRSGAQPGEFLFPEIMGGGAALHDLDGDGDLEAYLVQSGDALAETNPANQLFANDGRGRFTEVEGAGGADDGGYGMGVAVGDVDQDGDPDLYVTNLNANGLFVNDGALRFRSRAAAAGVDDPAWSTSTAFFDADRDGDLDLFVTNYVRWSPADERPCEQVAIGLDYCSPKAYRAPAPDTFYRNRGDGTFEDASSEAGLRTAFGNGLGVLCMDFDSDGWTDVFVANDGTVNQLWHNRQDGTFADEALVRGVGVDMDGSAKAGMGVSAADLDDDGDEDLLVVNLVGEADSFYRNEGEFFSDRTAHAGLARASRGFTRFGVAFADFDNDGRLDLFEANGRVSRAVDPPDPDDPYAEANLLFRRSREGRFEEVLPRGGTAVPLIATSRAAAFGDVDGDGGLDVLVVNRDASAHLLLNRVPGRAPALSVRLELASGAPALGAQLFARLSEPGAPAPRSIMRVSRSAYSYDAASDPTLLIGLGTAGGLQDVEVLWPDGSREAFGTLDAASSATVLRQGQGD